MNKEYEQLISMIRQAMQAANLLRKNLNMQEIQLHLQTVLQDIKTEQISLNISER